MKIGAAEVLRTYARPDPTRLGLLIYGNDAMRVALKRQEVIAAVIGPEGEAEMRLARIAAAAEDETATAADNPKTAEEREAQETSEASQIAELRRRLGLD